MSPQRIPAGFRVRWDDRPELARVIDAALTDFNDEIAEVPRGSNIIPGDPYRVHGEPWCAAAVSTWYFCGLGAAAMPFPWTPSTLRLRDWGELEGRLLAASVPYRMGDVFLIFNAAPDAPHPARHTGLIVYDPFYFDPKDTSGIVFCVEGNHADRVAITARKRTDFTDVLRPVPLL